MQEIGLSVIFLALFAIYLIITGKFDGFMTALKSELKK